MMIAKILRRQCGTRKKINAGTFFTASASFLFPQYSYYTSCTERAATLKKALHLHVFFARVFPYEDR